MGCPEGLCSDGLSSGWSCLLTGPHSLPGSRLVSVQVPLPVSLPVCAPAGQGDALLVQAKDAVLQGVRSVSCVCSAILVSSASSWAGVRMPENWFMDTLMSKTLSTSARICTAVMELPPRA